ncbi:hypothetical protein AN958_05860 [Leucoagaricus sp. SymC.cos]|nr:hypothetical protein AN958_05860 [Leucoagaricus sp. SymC.cos]
MHHIHNNSPSYRRNIQQSLVSRPTSALPKSPSPPAPPSNDDIEAVIQMATSVRQDGRTIPIKDTRTQLFLPYRVRWQDLKDLFRRAGTVLRADVSLGPDNRSRGYGTVLLATAEDAGRAIDMFHGYSWQTRILEVRPDRLPPDFDNPPPSSAPNSLAPPTAFSTPSSISLSSPLTSAIHLTSPSRSARNLSEDFDCNSLFGSEAANTSSSICRNLFVGNLPFHCQWQDLKDLFRQAGTIIRADVALGPDGRSRGFGTVVFATEADGERALKMFNGYEYNGRVLKVHFDRYSHLSQPSASPTHATFHQATSPANLGQPSFTTTMASRPNHITLPIGYHTEFLPPSGSSSPYDLYHTKVPIFSQSSQSQQQAQPPSRSHPQPHEQPSPQPPHDNASRSLHDVDSVLAQLASTSISTKSSPLSPLRKSGQLTNNSLSSVTTSENIRDDSPAQPDKPQFQSQELQAASTTQPQGQHPHHPGPISLPPPSLSFMPPPTLSPLHHTGMPMPISPMQHPSMGSPLHHPSIGSPLHHPSMGSPLHHPSTYTSHVPMTPHGLPPITPSMPAFIFHPVHPPASPTASAPTHTPTTHMPIYGTPSFSPTVAMSPGTFWGRPGNHHPNPFINPAVGAPVHLHSPGATRQVPPAANASIPGGNSGAGGGNGVNVNMNMNMNIGGSAYFYAPPRSGMAEPTGYFDPVYLPPSAPHSGLGPSGLAREILKEESELLLEGEVESGQGGDGNGKGFSGGALSTDTSPTNDEDPDDIVGRSTSRDSTSGTNTTCTFSEATSWYNSEESGDELTGKTHDLENIVGSSSRRTNGKNTGSRSLGTNTTASGSDAESKSGSTGLGFLGGERRIISRTHSMSGGAKPLFSSSFQSGSDSEPPTRTTSTGWPAQVLPTLSQMGKLDQQKI